MKIFPLFAVAVCGLSVSLPVSGDVLLEQPVDSVWRSFSTYFSPGAGTYSADDFTVQQPTRVTSLTFWMLTTWPLVPWEWSFRVHRSIDDNPVFGFAPEWDPFFTHVGASEVIDHGDWGGWQDPFVTRFFEIRFTGLDLLLDPAETVDGVFWITPTGHGSNSPFVQSAWLTSGDGEVNGQRAWGRFVPWRWPGWHPVSGTPSDLAFRVEGVVVPAPGVGMAMMLLPLLHRRRRRRG